MSKHIYKEDQRFRCWDVYLLLGFFIIALSYRFGAQFFSAAPADPMPLTTFLFFMGILLSVLAFVLVIRLKTRINEKGIRVKYFPLHRKKQKIDWEDVETYNVVELNAAAKWSGWKIHFQQAKNYGFFGNKGLHLRLKNGEDIFIGIKNIKQLREALKKVS